MSEFKSKLSVFCLSICNKDQLKSLGVGQIISLLATGTGTCSQLLAQTYNVNAPTAQSFFNYFLLALIYGLFIFGYRRRPFLATLRERLFVCLPLALVDVEANYLGTYGPE